MLQVMCRTADLTCCSIIIVLQILPAVPSLNDNISLLKWSRSSQYHLVHHVEFKLRFAGSHQQMNYMALQGLAHHPQLRH